MLSKKLAVTLSVLLLLSLVLVACGATPAPEVEKEVVKETVVVEKEVEVTTVVEKEVEVTTVVEKEVEVTTVVEKEVEVTSVVEVEVTSVPAAAEGPVYGGTLRVARPAGIYTWDPQWQDENDSLWAGIQIYSALLKVSKDGMSLEPFLADSYEASDDVKTFTFHLNEDAAFCDGSPITSADVKYSFERATESAAVSWMVPPGMHMDTPDDHTFVINLEEPNVALPWWVTLWGMQIVSKDYAESHSAEEMANEPLGSGVFCMDEWKRGEVIRLVPNEYSWMTDEAGNQLPYVDEVLWYIVPDANSRTLMLEAGEVDVAIDPPYIQLESLDAIEGISAIAVPLMGEATIWTNMETPFSDPKVRQAANYAIDKESMIDIVLQGYGQPAYSFLYLGMYNNEEYGFPFDLDKAKELMAESEYPDGFEAELLVKAGDTVMEETGVVLKDQLSKLGIDVTITPLESGTFFDRWFGSDFDMLYKLSTLDIYDSSENLSIDIRDAGFTGWENPELWEFAQVASAEPDEAKRAEMFDELQRRYMEAPPQLPLFYPMARWAQWDYVNGFQLMNTNLHPFYYTWLTPQ